MLLQLGFLYILPLVLLVNHVALSKLNSPQKVIMNQGHCKEIITIWSTIGMTEEQLLVAVKNGISTSSYYT
jgi:hypothetical protein